VRPTGCNGRCDGAARFQADVRNASAGSDVRPGRIWTEVHLRCLSSSNLVEAKLLVLPEAEALSQTLAVVSGNDTRVEALQAEVARLQAEKAIAELFRRNILEPPHTDEEVMKMVEVPPRASSQGRRAGDPQARSAAT
jgi:hypothetical protein